MADAIIGAVAERLAAIIAEQIQNEVKLVRGVDKEVLNLSEELKTIVNALDDADRRGFKDKSIKRWLKRLEEASNEMDDVLDEWNTAVLKLRMEQSNANAAGPTKSSKVCSYVLSLESGYVFQILLMRLGLQKEIIEGVGGTFPNTNQLDKLLQCLIKSISGKKFLLVLDDVWTEESSKWEPLKYSLRCGGEGSKILVTTRKETVVRMMGTTKNEIHHLGSLSD